jgi:hypothetical protein
VGPRGQCKSWGLYLFLWKMKRKSTGERTFCTPKKSITIYESNFVYNRILNIVLGGRWCNIIVLKAHAPSEANSDASKYSF